MKVESPGLLTLRLHVAIAPSNGAVRSLVSGILYASFPAKSLEAPSAAGSSSASLVSV